MSLHFLSSLFNRHPVALASVFLFVFSLGIYAGALKHGFVWDDDGILVKEQKIRDMDNIPSFFMTPLVLGESGDPETLDSGKIHYYRPLISTLHAVEYRFFGENPLGYKVINLLLNGAVVVCAFLLVRALTGELFLAFLTAFLYAANPARGEVVYWVYSDSHLLAGLCLLLALLAYHYGRTVLALVAVVAGFLCQESLVLFPVLLIVYHVAFVSKHDWKWYRLVPFIVLVASYLVFRQHIAGSLPASDVATMDHLRGIIYLAVKYVQVFFVTDAPVTMYLYRPGMFAAEGVLTTGIYFLAAILIALGVYLWWLRRVWFFWWAWFFVFIALSFNIGGYVDYLMAEKTLYLAALGPSFLIAVLVLRSGYYQWIALVFLSVLVGYQTYATVERGRYWSDTVTYLEKLVEFEPSYDVAQYQLGVEYMNLERYEDALRQFDLVLNLSPHMRAQIVALQVSIYEKWSRDLAGEDDLTGAQEKLHRAQQLSPKKSSVYNGLGTVFYLRGERAQAVKNWQRALRLDPNNVEARSNLKMFSESDRKH